MSWYEALTVQFFIRSSQYSTMCLVELQYVKTLKMVDSISLKSLINDEELIVGLYRERVTACSQYPGNAFMDQRAKMSQCGHVHVVACPLGEYVCGERERETSCGECTWDLWVPFNNLAQRSQEFASTETMRRRRFLRKRKITETRRWVKYCPISIWSSNTPCTICK